MNSVEGEKLYGLDVEKFETFEEAKIFLRALNFYTTDETLVFEKFKKYFVEDKQNGLSLPA